MKTERNIKKAFKILKQIAELLEKTNEKLSNAVLVDASKKKGIK